MKILNRVYIKYFQFILHTQNAIVWRDLTEN